MFNYNKEIMLKTGVYLITCTANNKIYIGSAAASKGPNSKIGFNARWNDHLRKLKGNRHPNRHLQFAWNKYGESCLEFEILKLCSKELCKSFEEYYIDLYNADNHNIGFNILRQHLANYNNPSEKNKRLLSLHFKGKKRPLEHVKKWSNKVQQIDNKGNIIAEYYSMSEAERQTGVMRQDIGQAIIGRKIKRAGGYFWKKVKDIV